MKTWCLTFACLASLGIASVSNAGPIVFSENVENTIKLETTKPLKLFTLDKVQMGETRALFRTWVSGSMDLRKARKHTNSRLNRTSYVQQATVETLRLPAERLQIRYKKNTHSGMTPAIRKMQLDPQLAKPSRLATPIQMVFREGGSHLKFQKIKETRAKSPLNKTKAIELAKNFLKGNQLLRTTEFDEVGQIYIQERRINEDRGTGKTPDDYLVQQDVVFERTVDGKPVVNSKIVVGFQPDTKDIVSLKHFNWTPIQQTKIDLSKEQLKISPRSKVSEIKLTPQPQINRQIAERTTPPSATTPDSKAIVRKANAQPQSIPSPTATLLRKRIETRVRMVSGESFAKAEVIKTVPGWFQTENELIPVLVFEVNVTVSDSLGEITEPYLELINLAGNDDVFFPTQQASSAPTSAP